VHIKPPELNQNHQDIRTASIPLVSRKLLLHFLATGGAAFRHPWPYAGEH
jgi:hypothetical protein